MGDELLRPELQLQLHTPRPIRVNVTGEVVIPGTIELMANTPLVQAVMAAGGPTNWLASKSNVHLVRINRNGTAILEKFQVNLAQGASNTKNLPLREGDTVKVNRSSLAKASDAIGALSEPLSVLVQL